MDAQTVEQSSRITQNAGSCPEFYQFPEQKGNKVKPASTFILKLLLAGRDISGEGLKSSQVLGC